MKEATAKIEFENQFSVTFELSTCSANTWFLSVLMQNILTDNANGNFFSQDTVTTQYYIAFYVRFN